MVSLAFITPWVMGRTLSLLRPSFNLSLYLSLKDSLLGFSFEALLLWGGRLELDFREIPKEDKGMVIEVVIQRGEIDLSASGFTAAISFLGSSLHDS